MNYYELIYLLNEFKTKLTNCWIEQAVTPFRNQLELFITNGKESFRLIFNTSPGNAALFLDSYRPLKKTNTQLFFDQIYGKQIEGFVLIENERLLSFNFEDGYKLWFKLFGSKANVFLSKDDLIVATFKDRDEVGSAVPVTDSPGLFEADFADDLPITKKVQNLLPLLPRPWIQSIMSFHDLEDLDKSGLVGFLKQLDLQLREKAEFRILEEDEVTLIPEKLLPKRTVRIADSVNELISYRFKNYARKQRLQQQKGGIQKSLRRQIKRLDSSLKNLYQADKNIIKADQYEKFGHLLMANAHQNRGDSDSIEVDDLYNNGERLRIPLLTDLNIPENAQRYYSRSSSTLKSYEEALKRIPELESKREAFIDLANQIDSINDISTLRDWMKENQNILKNLEAGGSQKEEHSKPFYTTECMGYTIWIGKNARSNDALVQQAHKEDIWLHARGVSGSHVSIRMNNSREMPDTTVIEEVASYAAYQSKAKGSSLVPVIYTKRKYVRKPKGAAPGTVLVQKENVVIVEPKNPFS